MTKSEKYIIECKRTESLNLGAIRDRFNGNERLAHAAFGNSTESAELLDAVKKFLFYGKPMDKVNIREEIGDQLWYLGILCDVLGTNFEIEMKRNIQKLKRRYPDKFTTENAINRNLDAERKVLEA